MRNLLCLLCWHCKAYYFSETLQFISVRGNKAQKSLVFKLNAKEYENDATALNTLFDSALVGWETNSNDKLGPTVADLSDAMDPAK